MNYIDESVAVGMMMMNAEGHDEIMVLHGFIRFRDGKHFFEAEDNEPFEMVESWLSKLKPVEESMGPEWQKSKYCMIIASVKK